MTLETGEARAFVELGDKLVHPKERFLISLLASFSGSFDVFKRRVVSTRASGRKSKSDDVLKEPSDALECLLSLRASQCDANMATQENCSSKDVLTRLDSLLTGGNVACDAKRDAKCDEPAKSVSDIFAKIIRDKLKPEKPVSSPLGILKKPESTGGDQPDKKKVKRRIR